MPSTTREAFEMEMTIGKRIAALRREKWPNIRLPIPTGLVLNRWGVGLVLDSLKKYGLNVTKEQAVDFARFLNRYRRSHPEWVLVEVESADGDYVKIKL
jgi:hypothetical protein